MKHSEVMALLQGHESYKREIINEVRTQRHLAEITYTKIYEVLRNSHFVSKDDRDYAYREAERFVNELFKPFNQGCCDVANK